MSHVIAAGAAASERYKPVAPVVVAGGVAIERLITQGGVVDAAAEALESIVTLRGVAAGIASVRCRVNPESFRGRPKPEAGECDRDEKETAPQRRAAQ